MPKGIVRKIDDLGRIVIPKEIRNSLGWDIKTPLEISVNGGTVFLNRSVTSCVLCDDTADLISIYGKPVCGLCRESFAKSLR